MLELRGRTFDFEVTNPDHLERFENAILRMQASADAVEQSRKGKRSSQYVRESCQCVLAFLDETLGDGAARALLGDSVSLVDCVELSEELAAQVAAQMRDVNRRFAQFSPQRLERYRA